MIKKIGNKEMLKAFLNERFPLIETLDDSFFFATASYFL